MDHKRYVQVFCVCVAMALPTLAEEIRSDNEGRLSGPSGGLFDLTPLHGWETRLALDWGKRGIEGAGVDSTVDVRALVLHGAWEPFSFLSLDVGIGGVQLDGEEQSGRGGFDGSVRIRAGLLNKVMVYSPYSGARQKIRLDLDGWYRFQQSEQDNGDDLWWQDFGLMPSVALQVFFKPNVDRADINAPVAAGIRVGALFSDLRGEWGEDRLRAQRNIGLYAGVEFLVVDHLVVDAGVRWYGGADSVVQGSVGYRF